MIKEALHYLVGLKDNKTYEINGETYSDNELHAIRPPVFRPNRIEVSGLDSIIQLVKREAEKFKDVMPIYIRVVSAGEVSVFTSYDKEMVRNSLYCARCDVPGFRDGFMDQERAIIYLRSKFVENEGVIYLLDLLSRISKEDGVTTSDNGISQEVVAKTGISLKQQVAIKPRVKLMPYRTFLEVPQPESEFLVRLNEHGDIGLFEADGGMWAMDAKRNILEHLSSALVEEINSGTVVVMM